MTPPISVALCTFNGSPFLDEQLQSVAAQTLLPAELLIFDDGSSDDTVAVARRFAGTAPFPVRVHVNQANLGCRGNFAACIAACTGETIVLSDQDDVWLPHKLERLAGVLAAQSGAAFAFSDALMADRHLNPLPWTLWEAKAFTAAERRAFERRRGFDVLLRRQIVTGATLAFRARFRDLLLPIPPGWVHDEWIALVLSAVAWGVPLPEPLIRYRQHPRQQIGERPRSLYEQYLRVRGRAHEDFVQAAGAVRAAEERLREKAPQAGEAIRALHRKFLHCDRRARMHAPGARRWPLILGEWWPGNYRKYSRGWKSLAQDVFL
ncbi:MAG: glycosyltransferase family 2 protein [Deltaproteobacteria bacterium]